MASPLSKRRAAALERAVRALTVDSGDGTGDAPSHLDIAVAAHRIAEIAERMARAEVLLARERDDASWADVGEAFGVNRQTAHERFRSGPDGAHTRSARLRTG